jgi:hypothetical protein
MNIYIKKTDLPTANIADDARLYAGRGWIALVQEAVTVICSAQIRAIREDAGLLRIELANATTEQRAQVKAIEAKSASMCEICGEPGSLRWEGLKDGKPAGWHRVRCDLHVFTRTSSWPVMPRISKRPSTADLSSCITVSQLTEILKQYPADMPVLVVGYETGFDEIHKVQTVAAAVNPEAEDWDGQYELADPGTACLLILGRQDTFRR